MKRSHIGFTLIEVMVVVTVMAILATVIFFVASDSSKPARDTERQADLRNVQSALELYKLRYDRYPAGCNAVGVWSGEAGTNYACSSGNQYIVALAPEFIPVLPTDPKLNGVNSGYVYTTNTNGSTYKFEVRNTVENEIVDYQHEFKSCDASSGQGVCNATYPSNSKPNHCFESNSVFQSSYAVWGGKPIEPNAHIPSRAEELLEDVICDIS